MMLKLDPTDLKPCRHMQTLVSAWVDGKLTGLARWYTEKHVQGCPQCQSSLPFLRSLHFRLSGLGKAQTPERLSEKRWEAVHAAWAQADPESRAENGTAGS